MAEFLAKSVVVNPAAIQSLFEPGGQVRKWADRRAASAVIDARISAPVATGQLKRSYKSTATTFYQGVSFGLTSNVRHALWVEEGTQGPITPKKGEWLKVPVGLSTAAYSSVFHRRHHSGTWARTRIGKAARGPAKDIYLRGAFGEKTYMLKRSVRGQRAQHIMADALETACREAGVPLHIAHLTFKIQGKKVV